MGDAGSNFIGFGLGVLALLSMLHGSMTVWTWFLLLGVFVSDATVTLVRRIVRGDRWYEGHCCHAYQHAVVRFGSHRRVTLADLALNCLWSGAACMGDGDPATMGHAAGIGRAGAARVAFVASRRRGTRRQSPGRRSACHGTRSIIRMHLYNFPLSRTVKQSDYCWRMPSCWSAALSLPSACSAAISVRKVNCSRPILPPPSHSACSCSCVWAYIGRWFSTWDCNSFFSC